jgi:hypothetical protein
MDASAVGPGVIDNREGFPGKKLVEPEEGGLR